jgi:uncharacterized protein (TIGR02246 family)
MHKAFIATIAAVCAPMVACAQSTQKCEPVSEEQIAALFDRWNDSLLTKNPDEVVKNYAADAVLLPTMSNKVRTTPGEIRDYFVHFLESSPRGVINTRTIHLGCNVAFDVGTYTFTVTGPDGKTSQVPARYSFVYEFKDGKWLIAHHHSSAMPEAAPVAAH